jgi:hypothetical protein
MLTSFIFWGYQMLASSYVCHPKKKTRTTTTKYGAKIDVTEGIGSRWCW